MGNIKYTSDRWWFVSLMLVVMLCLTSCDEEGDGVRVFTGKPVRVLAIGNSFALDTYSYVPFMLQDILEKEDCEVTVGMYYISGGSLEDHYNNYRNAEFGESNPHHNSNYTMSESGKIPFYYMSNKTNQNSWDKRMKTLTEILTQETWDIIVLQQVCGSSANYDSYQPYLDELIKIIRDKCPNKNAVIGYNVAHRMIGKGSDFNGTISVAKRLLEETGVEILFPYSTALENAMRTPLKDLPYENERMTADGLHLQEGLPCQIAAYVETQVILDILYPGQTIIGNKLRFTAEWASGKNIPGPHGSYIGSTDENSRIGQICAMLAVENPYEIVMKEEADSDL